MGVKYCMCNGLPLVHAPLVYASEFVTHLKKQQTIQKLVESEWIMGTKFWKYVFKSIPEITISWIKS